MSRQEAERIAAQVLMGWQDDAFSWSYEITDEQARKVVAALADAGLLADPAKNDEPSWSAAGGPCALCGRDPAAGYASSFDGDKAIWLCHDSAKRTCYVRWTVYDERPAAGTPEEQTPDERQTR